MKWRMVLVTIVVALLIVILTGCGEEESTTITVADLEAQLGAAWEMEAWPVAIEIVEQLLETGPNADYITKNLYSAHVNYGFQLYGEGSYQQARSEFEAALGIMPTGEGALQGIEMITNQKSAEGG